MSSFLWPIQSVSGPDMSEPGRRLNFEQFSTMATLHFKKAFLFLTVVSKTVVF